jgi:hypothetical protein
MLAISGISRGAASSLDIARVPSARMRSVGLDTPAIDLTTPVEAAQWPCFIDAGDQDPLARAATRTAATLRSSGIDVVERHWPGGHNRAYWRRHLADYLAFHVDNSRLTTS